MGLSTVLVPRLWLLLAPVTSGTPELSLSESVVSDVLRVPEDPPDVVVAPVLAAAPVVVLAVLPGGAVTALSDVALVSEAALALDDETESPKTCS